MNRFFIKKLSGIRLSVISNSLLVLATLVCVFLLSPGKRVNAAETYTFELKDQAQTLSGTSVDSQFNFEKPNYWQVKQATITLNFQLTSLSLRQDSTLTLAINGVKFTSFRPKKTDQRQTWTVSLPVDLLEDNNVLQLSGQITTQGKTGFKNEQTPADWLTLYPGTTVNFRYTEVPPDPTLSSFFTRFMGIDKISMNQSTIVIPDNADNETLSAALIALTARPDQTAISASGRVGLRTFSAANQQDKYRVVVARYDQLPVALKKALPGSRLKNQGLLQTVYSQGHYDLVVTARSNKMLRKAAAYFANHELMAQTNKSMQQVSVKTDTSQSNTLQLEQQLTTKEQTFTGPGEQQKLFAVSLPAGQTQSLGSQITLHYQYSAKLSFKKAKIKVYVNDQLAGQKKLTRKKAQGDSLVIKLPQRSTIQNGYLIKVAFVLAGQNKQQKEQTVWAKLQPDSVAQIK